MQVDTYKKISRYWPNKVIINGDEYRYHEDFVPYDFFKALHSPDNMMNKDEGIEIIMHSGKKVSKVALIGCFVRNFIPFPIKVTIGMLYALDYFGASKLPILDQIENENEIDDVTWFFENKGLPIPWKTMNAQFPSSRVVYINGTRFEYSPRYTDYYCNFFKENIEYGKIMVPDVELVPDKDYFTQSNAYQNNSILFAIYARDRRVSNMIATSTRKDQLRNVYAELIQNCEMDFIPEIFKEKEDQYHIESISALILFAQYLVQNNLEMPKFTSRIFLTKNVLITDIIDKVEPDVFKKMKEIYSKLLKQKMHIFDDFNWISMNKKSLEADHLVKYGTKKSSIWSLHNYIQNQLHQFKGEKLILHEDETLSWQAPTNILGNPIYSSEYLKYCAEGTSNHPLDIGEF